MGELMKCLVVGHLTRDVIVRGSSFETRIGGGAYYSAAALSRFCDVEVLTSYGGDFPEEWVKVLEEMGITVNAIPGERSTTYRLEYFDASRRELTLISTAAKIDEVPDGRYDIIVLNPVAGEIGKNAIESAKERGKLIGADVQGFIRQPLPGKVRATGIPFEVFRGIHVLHADVSEAGYIRGLDPEGVEVLLISNGEEEGTVYRRGRAYRYRPAVVRVEETTGAGDVFLAAFTYFYRECPFVQALKKAGAFTALFLKYRHFDFPEYELNETAMRVHVKPLERKAL